MSPTGGPSARETPAGGIKFSCPGMCLRGPRPLGNAMTSVMAEGPAPGSPETTLVSALGARGDRAPSPAARQGVQGRVVFVDFGRDKVYALTADGNGVLVFDSLEDVVGKLSPTVVVLDNLPNKLQNTTAELAKTGITFLRLKDLKKVAEERKATA